MNLIDRYVNEIVRRLPRKQQDDVRQELLSALADALESRVDGDATDAETVALLREFGRPEAVAASYRPEDQYLIGPPLYPSFKQVTAVVVVVLTGLVALGFAVDLLRGPDDALWVWFLRLFSELWEAAITGFGIVVLIFGLLQRFENNPTLEQEPWDPRELPAIRDQDVVGHGEALAGIVLPIVFLVLFNVFRGYFGVRVNPGSELLLNEVFLESLPWINLGLVLGIALNTWLLKTGRWHGATRLLDFAIDAYWVFVLFGIAAGVATRESELIDAGVPESVSGLMVKSMAFLPWLVALLVLIGACKALYRALIAARAA